MCANNSCGARSIRYGNMVHNVLEIEAWLSSGEIARFREVAPLGEAIRGPANYQHIIEVLRGPVFAEVMSESLRLMAVPPDALPARDPGSVMQAMSQ
jgi:hypothetical protein